MWLGLLFPFEKNSKMFDFVIFLFDFLNFFIFVLGIFLFMFNFNFVVFRRLSLRLASLNYCSLPF